MEKKELEKEWNTRVCVCSLEIGNRRHEQKKLYQMPSFLYVFCPNIIETPCSSLYLINYATLLLFSMNSKKLLFLRRHVITSRVYVMPVLLLLLSVYNETHLCDICLPFASETAALVNIKKVLFLSRNLRT